MQILDQNVPVCEAYNAGMALSARNRLKGTVEEVVLGTVMAHVVVRVGDNLIESAITRRTRFYQQI
jgi:ABC-type molybdate transport system ATPase subunit